MHQTWVIVSGIAIMMAGIGVIRGEVGSPCETLTQAKQEDQAFPVCLAAAKQGNAYAQNIVGVSYAAGDGVEQNSSEALKWLYKSAGQGFAKAQSNIGLAFLTHHGVNQDYAQAVKWWQQAADQGEPSAQYNLAVSYACGCGIEQNNALATQWYLLASFAYLKLGLFEHALNSVTQVHLL